MSKKKTEMTRSISHVLEGVVQSLITRFSAVYIAQLPRGVGYLGDIRYPIACRGI